VIGYVLFRLALVVPLLFGLSLLVFVIGRVLPGDPVGLAAGPFATAEQRAQIAADYGLDQPLPVQYATYVAGVFEGDFGRSLVTRRPVAEDLMLYLPATLELVFVSLLLAVAVAIPLGLIAGATANRAPDAVISTTTVAAMSMPQFFLGLLLQLAFGMALSWLPLSGRLPFTMAPPPLATGLYTVDSLIAGQWHTFWLSLQHLALPAVTMSLVAHRHDHAHDARLHHRGAAAGLRPQRAGAWPRAAAAIIVFKYVLKNAMSATLTSSGSMSAGCSAGPCWSRRCSTGRASGSTRRRRSSGRTSCR
jgi:peptide/nickel transport system permease protein